MGCIHFGMARGWIHFPQFYLLLEFTGHNVWLNLLHSISKLDQHLVFKFILDINCCLSFIAYSFYSLHFFCFSFFTCWALNNKPIRSGFLRVPLDKWETVCGDPGSHKIVVFLLYCILIIRANRLIFLLFEFLALLEIMLDTDRLFYWDWGNTTLPFNQSDLIIFCTDWFSSLSKCFGWN